MRFVSTCMIFMTIMLPSGCISTPVAYRVRVHADIANASERAIGFRMNGPTDRDTSVFIVIANGILTQKYVIEESGNSAGDFLLGSVRAQDWRSKGIALEVTDGSRSIMMPLPFPDVHPLSLTCRYRVRVPEQLEHTTAEHVGD